MSKTMKTVGIIMGVLTGLLGAYAMFTPFRTFLSIGWILGILFTANGIQMVIMSLKDKKKDIWHCILGIVIALAGCILIFGGLQRILTDVMVACLVGICLLIYGVFEVISGCRKYGEKKGSSILLVICGILSVIVGVIAIGHPVMTMISIGYIIAFNILLQGINMVLLFARMETEEKYSG